MAKTDIRGKVVLVTGAARGIGAETARALTARGARVALVGREPERLAGLARELGGDAAWFEADVSDASAVARAVDGAAKHFGGLDVVLSNAGIAAYGMLATMDPRQFERVFAVNLRGTWHMMRAALVHLVARRGYFLGVASLAAATSVPGMGAYAASKAATESLLDTLRQEVAHQGVGVGCAYFGFLDTDMVATAETHPAFQYMRRHLPKPIRAIEPVKIAVDALVDGITHRRVRVIAPAHLHLVLAARHAMAPLAALVAVRSMPRIDALNQEAVAAYGGPAKVPTTEQPPAEIMREAGGGGATTRP